MVFLLGSIYKAFTWQSQTVLGHFSDGHFAVTSQTSLHLVQKTVCVFVKRKCGLNEDLWQWTIYVQCITPTLTLQWYYNVVGCTRIASSKCFRGKKQTVFQLQTGTKYFHTWLASFHCIVFSTVEHKKKLR